MSALTVASDKGPDAARTSVIVVLETDPHRAAVLRGAFADRGLPVVTTLDVRIALRLARDGRLDLLVADVAAGALDVVPHGQRRRTDPSPVDTRLVTDGYAVLRPLGADPECARFSAVTMKPPVGPQDGLAAQRFALLEAIPGASTASAVVSAVDAALSFPKTPSEAQPSPSAAPRAWRRAASDGSDAAEPAFAALPRPLLKALVVDGDAEYRCFLRGLLEAHGFEVNHAANGSDGIEVALARRPWLILTDVDIPGMDGFEFCRRVRSHGLLEHTPLVFLSAWDDYGERYHGLRLGANDYVSKRMPTRELLIRLQLVLKRYADVRTTRGTGMAGEIELVGAPGLLQMCHLGRLTGLCTVRAGMVRIQIRFREGQVLGAASSRARGADAVYELLSWSSGQFEFQPCDPGDGQPLTESFDYLLLEGCRRLDDERRQTAIGSSGAPPPEESDTRSARPRGVGLH